MFLSDVDPTLEMLDFAFYISKKTSDTVISLSYTPCGYTLLEICLPTFLYPRLTLSHPEALP